MPEYPRENEVGVAIALNREGEREKEGSCEDRYREEGATKRPSVMPLPFLLCVIFTCVLVEDVEVVKAMKLRGKKG
jgi:hypothetical protein